MQSRATWQLEDRVAGLLVGIAAGDALGAGYEFTTPGPDDPQMVGGGALGWEPGQWTDDTEQSICVAEAVRELEGSLDGLVPAVGERLLRWCREGPRDVGIQTSAVLGDASSAAELPDVARRYHERYPDRSAGNGSLMRAAPVVLAALRDREADDRRLAETARRLSGLTHGDPLAGDACVLWTIAVDRALREGRLDGLDEGLALLPLERLGDWVGWLAEARNQPYRRFTGNGYVVRALQAAVAAITQTQASDARHLRAALRNAVSIGDDTDSVAAIAGALLGACYGRSAVPPEWQLALHGWPGATVGDLARLALSAGIGPVALAPEEAPAGEAAQARPCPKDSGVLLANLPGALEQAPAAGAVLSLSRTGPATFTDPSRPWLQAPLPDDDGHPNVAVVLADLAEQIGRWRDEGRTVLVHATTLASRVPSVTAAYLARRFGLSGQEAVELTLAALPGASVGGRAAEALSRLWPAG